MGEETGCNWAKSSEREQQYHDEEWCVPSYDDRYLFEMLNLEGAQAGLSWRTILNKREAYKRAFAHFDIEKCANLSEEELEELRHDEGIIRNRLKIQAVKTNAKAALKVQAEFGSFSSYIWHFTSHKRVIHQFESEADMPAQDELSERVSRDMKKRGFKFVGPVIIYSYLQAVGVLDDHVLSCPLHSLNQV
ncbi:DNA-3-methyladenine glycosylase I [Listeria aquatica]|uniref:DNA-3-methyladenine glycosylase I n=1 Tax=Listeria aquatica TaxID=1494960 RepID=A0A841ZN78_9LIST|nr:DNA-3-methyladenine glycosylase I [Listeria aquatica]